jgi:hypothetical protein
MEPKVSSSCLQELVTCSYPEPDQFSPYNFNIIFPFMPWSYKFLFLSGFTTKHAHAALPFSHFFGLLNIRIHGKKTTKLEAEETIQLSPFCKSRPQQLNRLGDSLQIARSGDRIPIGERNFPHSIQPALGPTHPPVGVVVALFSGGRAGAVWR